MDYSKVQMCLTCAETIHIWNFYFVEITVLHKPFTMHISREGIQVTSHFFEAIEMLKSQGIISGLQILTREYGINRWNMATVRNNHTEV